MRQTTPEAPVPLATAPTPRRWPAALWDLGMRLSDPRVRLRLAWALVLAAILVDILLVGHHALVRYQSYRAQAFDLGNMDQAVWNTLHGAPFRFTNRGLDWEGPPTRLGVHVEPILLLLAPFYLLHPGPETLLVLQTVALALGAIPLFLLATHRLPRMPLTSVGFVVAYLASPQLLGEALWDFHPVTLATPLLLLALWALDTRHYRTFAVAAVLAAATKEDVGLALVVLGALIILRYRRVLLGGLTSGLAAAWAGLCFFVILPAFGAHDAGNNFWYRYDWLGATAGEAVTNVLADPLLPLRVVLDPEKRAYLGVLLRTAGGLGLFAPFLWLAALPDVAINVLSTQEAQYSAFYQYNAVLLPFLVAAAIYGVSVCMRALRAAAVLRQRGTLPAPSTRTRLPHLLVRLRARALAVLARVPLRARWLAPVVLVWLLISSVWNLHTAGPVVHEFWLAGSNPRPDQAQIDGLLARIPRTASVAATESLNPHLSARYTIYLMPDEQSYEAEYVAYSRTDGTTETKPLNAEMFTTMLASGSYTVLGSASEVTVLQRTGPPLTPPNQSLTQP